MDRRWKPGRAAGQKTRSRAKHITAGIVLLTWLLSVLACSQGYSEIPSLPTIPDSPRTLAATTAAPTQPPATQIVLAPTVDIQPGTGIPADIGPVEATPVNTPTRPTRTATSTVTPGPSPTPRPPILYYAKAGDTLPVVALHFGVDASQITSPDPIPNAGFIRPSQLLIIPDELDPEAVGLKQILIPDSEVVYSPSAVDFDITTYVNEAGGYLSHYKEWMSTGWASGADVLKRVAVENSINPRVLLAIIEFQAHWVTGEPQSLAQTDYPVGYIDLNTKGLYKQLSWAVQQLSIGYYGWQAGRVNELEFSDSKLVRLWPQANAGTVAVSYLFSRMYNSREWANILDSKDQGFTALHTKMFGNPWLRAQLIEPLFPADFAQPPMTLPYPVGESWAFSGGPHPAWGPNGALAAVDFAPPSMSPGCVESNDWVTSSVTGKVVRVGVGVVVIDSDSDDHEQTGWDILYLHIATRGKVQVGDILEVGDKIGHPSCEGGQATGTHVHMARKYNGQWILADGPIPMVLSGWQVHAGDAEYVGAMTREGAEVVSCTCGSAESRVMHYPDK